MVSKQPFKTPERVVRYIGRYTHKVAISNQRILSIDKGFVRFRYKDYKDRGRVKETTLCCMEFIRRFLMHVLPNRFHRIRHYGLFANGQCKAKVNQIRKLLSSEDESTCIEEEKSFKDQAGMPCPVCEKGRLAPMVVVYRPGHVVLNVLFILLGRRLAWDTS